MIGPDGWTMVVCDVDLRPGGGTHYVWRREDGTQMEIRSVYREIGRPERLVETESWGGDWPDTLDILTLSEANGRTTMTATMLYPSAEARDKALQTGMKDGMSLSFDRLERYLRTLA